MIVTHTFIAINTLIKYLYIIKLIFKMCINIHRSCCVTLTCHTKVESIKQIGTTHQLYIGRKSSYNG